MILVLLAFIGFVSAFLQSAIGFGAALVMINVIPFFLPPFQAVLIAQFSCLSFSVYIVVRSYRKIRFDVLIPFLIPAMISSVVATRLSLGLDMSTMKLMLGILFVILSLYFSFFAGKISIKPTKTAGIIIGTVSGACNGLFGASGPPSALYLTPALPDKDEYIATIQAFFMMVSTMSISTKIISGAVSVTDFQYIVPTAASAVLGSATGLTATRKLKGLLLRRLIYAFIGINGIVIIVTQLYG